MTQAATQPAVAPGPAPLSLGVKILYGVGEISNAIKVVTFGLYGLFFATVVKGLPGTWIGIVGFIAMLWDAVIDPYIGHLTDGAGAARKRYRFMLIGALTMGIGFWGFFSPPPHLSTGMLFAWLLAASFVVRTATSMYTIPYYAVGVSLSRDYHERTSITGIRGMASAVGTLLTASLSFVIFFPEKIKGVDPKLDASGYGAMGLAFGLVMTLVSLIAIWGTLPLRRRLDTGTAELPHAPAQFFTDMWKSLRNPTFRIMLVSFCLVVIALAVNNSLLIHFLKYYMEINESATLSSFQVAFFSAGLLGTVFWLRLAKSFDKHRLYVISAVATAVLMLIGLVLFGKGHPLGTGNARPLLFGYALTGFFNCVLWFMPQSMLADIADENEWITGTRHEGALFGMLSFAQQVAAGIAIVLAGTLLDRFVKFVPGASQQPALLAWRIAILYSVIPAALFLSAAALMLGYKLSRSRVESIQTELRRGRVAQAANGG
jgi:Na+/melibiose symporter-like transporter